jgi:hypothetical protein
VLDAQRLLLLALCVAAGLDEGVFDEAPEPPPPRLPSPALNFEVNGILFHNKSLGLDHNFGTFGHQCAPGKSRPVGDGLLSYTPNRYWPDAKEGRIAFVIAVGGPLRRYLDNMLVRPVHKTCRGSHGPDVEPRSTNALLESNLTLSAQEASTQVPFLQ